MTALARDAALQEQDVLRAVIATPEDDFPRLQYADWCEENDQQARADLIRAQVELATLPIPPAGYTDNCPCCGHRRTHQDGCRFLVCSQQQWGAMNALSINPFGCLQNGMACMDRWHWSRGFVERVECSLDAWCWYGPDIAVRHPLARVTALVSSSQCPSTRGYLGPAGEEVDIVHTGAQRTIRCGGANCSLVVTASNYNGDWRHQDTVMHTGTAWWARPLLERLASAYRDVILQADFTRAGPIQEAASGILIGWAREEGLRRLEG